MDNPKKKIIFLRASDIHREPRAEKEIGILLDDYKIEVLCWDREGKFSKTENKNGYLIHRCQIKGRYGSGLKNVFPMIKWQIYEFFWLMKNQFDAVHVCDFDVYLPALAAAKLKRKKIVYDIFDFYGEMIVAPRLLKNFIKKIDAFLTQFADGVIVTDENRINKIKELNLKRAIVIYNTPPDFYDKFYKNIEDKKKTDVFTMAYIGLIEKGRGCDILLQMAAEIPNTNFIFGGFSIYESDEILKKKMENIPNVIFLGRVFPYEKTLEMLSKCDAMFALYDPSAPMHKYSSANKVFESMMLGKPIVVAENTGMDKIVEKHKTGLIVEYGDKEQIKQAILKLIGLKKDGNNFYGDNGRKAYLNVFNIKIMKERMLKFYAEILEPQKQ